MRINKYRGRRSYDKKWIYGSLLIDNNGDFHILESNIIEKDGHHIHIDSDSPMFFDNDTIEQFTGLHDKNVVEIYENDKVFDGKYHGIIEYKECSFVINWEIDCSHDDDLNYWNDKIEVVGNIHERSD